MSRQKKSPELVEGVLAEQGALDVQSLGDKLRDFLNDVAVAEHLGKTEIETHASVVEHFNPSGTGSRPYFFYKSLKVFVEGKREEAEALDRRTAEDLSGLKIDPPSVPLEEPESPSVRFSP